METVELKTVRRSACEAHPVFLNSIRHAQPHRSMLTEYFGERHWHHKSLESCVASGMQLAEDAGEPFTWLTCANSGSSEVCEAALRFMGVSEDELASGYFCDPTAKSNLRIVAKRGIMIRLTRNFDKQRGFVNGALAAVCDSLRGDAVFTARLVGAGNMVLIHPMEEKGERFLPCCYGYATTIRRAQGADLYHGCIYFDQKSRVAARGYGYVACSRFKFRTGCYLYGKLRQNDFLPVGPELEDEVLERGYESVSSADSDGRGLEYAMNDSQQDDADALELVQDQGNLLQDFL